MGYVSSSLDSFRTSPVTLAALSMVDRNDITVKLVIFTNILLFINLTVPQEGYTQTVIKIFTPNAIKLIISLSEPNMKALVIISRCLFTLKYFDPQKLGYIIAY